MGRSCADTVVGGVRQRGRRPCAESWTQIASQAGLDCFYNNNDNRGTSGILKSTKKDPFLFKLFLTILDHL